MALYSGELADSLALDELIATVQDGLALTPDDALPLVHYVFRREGEASHTELFKTDPPNRRVVTKESVEDQLRHFLTDGLVAAALQVGGPVYLVIGAHGRPPRGIATKLLALFLSFFSFRLPLSKYFGNIFDAWRRLFKDSLPVGAAFGTKTSLSSDFMSLDALNKVLTDFFPHPLTAVVLHSCNLSSIEAIYGIDHTSQQVACESKLSDHMNLRDWIPLMGRGEALEDLIGVIAPAEGVFSSNNIDACELEELGRCLSNLGGELKNKLASHATPIDDARIFSRLDCLEMVDVCLLCSNLKDVCSEPVLSELKCAIKPVQLDRAIVGDFRNNLVDAGGIGLFFPCKTTSSQVSDLPDPLQKVASGWVDFLREWTSQQLPHA